jgi:23S rRNA (uracil1939-C5)-methyltransferase
VSIRLEATVPLYGGYVLSRAEGVVFLKGAIPGETVEAEITEKKRDYSIALVREIHEPSPNRVEPRCPLFGLCGGCHYQHISYAGQIRIKEAVLRDLLSRIGKIELSLDASFSSEPWNYRRRARFKVSSDGRAGFYKPLSHDVVVTDECLLLRPELNEVLKRINSHGLPGGVRELLIQSGDIITARVYGERYDRRKVRDCLSTSGVDGFVFDDSGEEGAVRSCLGLGGMYYCVTPGAFFQSNWSMNLTVIEHIMDEVSRERPSRVLDLYAGGGNFSIPVSGFARDVVAVEQSTLSVADGHYNIELNGIENVRYIKGSAEKARLRGSFDLFLVDPPRTGLSREVLKRMVDFGPEWIYYISCNPSTLARDLGRLSELYEVDSIRLVDMFPQTYHIESLAKLRRRK